MKLEHKLVQDILRKPLRGTRLVQHLTNEFLLMKSAHCIHFEGYML